MRTSLHSNEKLRKASKRDYNRVCLM